MDEAAGGGGGSIKYTGQNGGSGGGGSEIKIGTRALTSSGGTPVNAAYGNSGGKGDCDYIGGGGGGAGSAGTDASKGANGGAGKASTITGSEVYYAAGGGGGLAATSGALAGGQGGSGIGGNGGDGSVAATDGAEGTGSGGGGGSVKGPGGKGGDGIVILRISLVVDGPLENPKYVEYPYTGNKIVAATSIPNVLTVTGEYEATDVREEPYEYHAELAEGFKWTDGTSDPVDVTWRIVPGTNSIPTPKFTEVTYDETKHTAVELPPNAKFKFIEGSVTAATDVGEYSYTAELLDKTNWRWADGSTSNQTFKFSITPRTLTPPTLPQGLVYGGTNVVAVADNAHFWTNTADSVTNAVDAGTYKVTFVLTDPANNVWPDGSVTNLTYSWTIARLPIDKPPIPGDKDKKPGVFVYNGQARVIATNSLYWVRQGDYQSSERGEYTAVLKLNGNWCWKGSAAEDRGSTEDYVIDWVIEQAPNEITLVKLADWKLGESPKTPSCEAKFGANTAIYEYGKSATGYEWEPDPPETNGVFYVRATIPPTENWKGAQKSKRFLIYKSFDELYTDFVEIEFPSCTNGPTENAVVLIKISEKIFRGFTYERCGAAENLAFMDYTEGQSYSPLSFDIDTWNDKNGESYVWVKIPYLNARAGYAKTKIRMYWHLREGMEAAGPSPDDVWVDYAGVWHFSEEISADPGTVPSKDSTGHGYDAYPACGTAGNLSKMTSGDAIIGRGRINAAANYTTGGNRLEVKNFENCTTLGTNFIFSGWVRVDGYMSGTSPPEPWIIARKGGLEEDGWALALNSNNRKRFDLWGVSKDSFSTSEEMARLDIKDHWEYITWAVAGDKYWLYTWSMDNGNYVTSGTMTSPPGDGLTRLAFGADADSQRASLNGRFDEFRLRKWGPEVPIGRGGVLEAWPPS